MSNKTVVPLGYKRGYVHLSKAWYGATSLKESRYEDEITIGVYRNDGDGTLGDFSIKWFKFTSDKCSPILEVFDGSWEVFFKYFGDLMEQMALVSGKDYTPEDFCKNLDFLKIENCTPSNPK